MNDKYDTNIIKHEILAIFYDNKTRLNTILHRHFIKKDYTIRQSNSRRFNILFGLFTIEERILFLEYIFQDNGIWVIKS